MFIQAVFTLLLGANSLYGEGAERTLPQESPQAESCTVEAALHQGWRHRITIQREPTALQGMKERFRSLPISRQEYERRRVHRLYLDWIACGANDFAATDKEPLEESPSDCVLPSTSDIADKFELFHNILEGTF